MQKSELIKQLAEKTGISQKKVNEVVKALTEAIKENVKKGERIALPDFGVFKSVERKERKIRHVQTGQMVNVPARKAIKFVPSKKLK